TTRLFDDEFATYSRDPFGESASATGSAPTPIVARTFRDVNWTTETLPSPALATYAKRPSGGIATTFGAPPTATSSTFVLWGSTRNIVMESASGFTLTRKSSSRERAIGLDCDGPVRVDFFPEAPLSFWASIAPLAIKLRSATLVSGCRGHRANVSYRLA